MKKIRLNLAFAALLLGATAAFAFTPVRHNNGDPLFNWQETDAAGDVVNGGMYVNQVSLSDAEAAFICSGNGDDCAVTVNHQDGQPISSPTYIKQNQ